MAEFWSNNDRGYRIRLQIDQTSQNIAGNSSQVRVRLSLHNNTYTFDGYNCSAYVDVNGQRLNWSGRPTMLSNNSTIMLIDQTITVGHNTDGTKSFGLSARFSGSGGWSPGTLTIGGNSFTLSTIPRSSSISVGAGTIGSAITINISRQSSSFKHTLRYHWGNKTGTIATNVDTSTTWTIPNDFANEIPNSTSGTGTIYVDTYSGSTKTGTQSVSFRADVPASMKPTFSNITLTDTNGVARGLLTGNNFLQIISNVQVTFNGASGSYGSSITGYRAEIVNRNQVTTSNGGRLGMMNFNGSATIRASVVDSRGRQSDTRDITINVIEYFSPILSFSAVRTRETPNIIRVVRNAKIAPITLSGSQKNVMTLTFKVAPLGSTSYTADNGSATGTFTTQHTLTNSAANMAGNYPANKSFTVIGTLADKFTSIEFSATVATESVVMSYDKDGRVAIGKVVEQGRAGSLDAAGDIYAGGIYFRSGQEIQNHALTKSNGFSIRKDNADFNTIKTSGFYVIGGNVSNHPNLKSTYYYLTVIQHDAANYCYQIAVDRNDGAIFSRVCENGTWRPWFTTKQKEVVLPRNDVITKDIALPFGMSGKLVRQNNVVTLTVERKPVTLGTPGEYKMMNEKIPAGFTPVTQTTLLLMHNAGTTIYPMSKLYLETNKDIRMTWSHSNYSIATGTLTYITNDPYP
ncbi:MULTISPECIES: DUF859 domain-containing protein [Streptococcus]|uniref:DUF859 domain-containing protein n=1 Tax=Streptococcus caledonicus TaxID=2614158 RepID=A0ABW0UBI3_9STRE|nr:DUF859 domain-containing protein [Streptococcus sp. S784/96/1]